MSGFFIALAAALVAVSLTGAGARFARRCRRMAPAAASLLLMFGLNFKIDPPPPPRLEAERSDEEEETNGEPR